MRRDDPSAYVYIMANDWQVLYVGVTSVLERRVQQHKDGSLPNSFTSRYRLHKLVHMERFSTISAAIAREKQIKGWSRLRKIELIVNQNPGWKDLSAEWGEPIVPFQGE